MCLISDSHKFIYLCGGKCATGSIINAIKKDKSVQTYVLEKKNKSDWNKFNKHMPAKIVKKRVGEKKWNDYFKFTFVRNPYDWVSSVFFFHVKRGMKGYQTPKDGLLKKEHIRLIVDYCKSPIGKRYDNTVNMRTQYGFASNINGDIELNYIGKVENIQYDFDKICKKLKIKSTQLENRNVSSNKTKSYRDRYTPEARKVVEKYWKQDIKYFNYSF